MAEDKKSALIYADIIHTIEELVKLENGKEKVGELFITILEYINDRNPIPKDPIVRITFEPIKQQMKRDLKKWERRADKSRENGKQGGRPKEPKEPTGLLNNLDNLTGLKKPDTVTVTDTVNDTVNVSVKTPQNLIDIFFNDLPTSSQLEQISRNLHIPKDKLILRIPEFKKRARIEYPNFPEFCNHFKNWVQKIPTEQQPIKRRQ